MQRLLPLVLLAALAGLGACEFRSESGLAATATRAPVAEPESIREDEDRPALAALPNEVTLADGDVTRQPWTYGSSTGQLISTPNYRIHTTVSKAHMLAQLPLFLERAMAHYTISLGELPQPDQPLELYLFGHRREWEAKTREVLHDQAQTYLNLGRGGFTKNGVAVLYDIDRRWRPGSDTFAIAAHEGWHQYTQQTFDHSLPIWLEEGVATYMEGFVGGDSPQFRPWSNRERYFELREAYDRGRLIPLAQLLERTPQSFLESGKENLLTYYAQVWALTLFLAEAEEGRYARGLHELLNDAAHGRLTGRLAEAHSPGGSRRGRWMLGRLGPLAVRHYFTPDLDQFESEFLSFVRFIITDPAARRRIIREGRSPFDATVRTAALP